MLQMLLRVDQSTHVHVKMRLECGFDVGANLDRAMWSFLFGTSKYSYLHTATLHVIFSKNQPEHFLCSNCCCE